jgi:hypothetical protein
VAKFVTLQSRPRRCPTSGLLNELVYELYGLTDEEIAIVEEAVGD